MVLSIHYERGASIHPVTQQILLRMCSVQCSHFGTGGTVMGETDIIPALQETLVKGGTQTAKQAISDQSNRAA